MSSSRIYEWNDDERNVLDHLPSSSYHSEDTNYKPVYVLLKEMYEEDARRLYCIEPSETRVKTIYDYLFEEDDDEFDGEYDDADAYSEYAESVWSYSHDGATSDEALSDSETGPVQVHEPTALVKYCYL